MSYSQMSSRILFFERDDYLYSAVLGGGGSPTHLHRRAELPYSDFEGADAAWTISSDGRHLMGLAFREPQRAGRPRWASQVWNVEQRDLINGRSRLLFQMPYSREANYDQDATRLPKVAVPLRGLSGHPLVSLAADPDAVDMFGDREDTDLNNWKAFDLCLASDNRTLFITIVRMMPGDMPVPVTCTVDLRTGRAITNHRGHWRVASYSHIYQQRGGLLIGIGNGRTNDGACNACTRYQAVHVGQFGRFGSDRSLLPGTFDSKHKPPYAFAGAPALSPDGRTIVFSSWIDTDDNNHYRGGLWAVDRHTRRYRQLTEDHDDIRQMVWENAHSLLMRRFPNNAPSNAPSNLYRLPIHPEQNKVGRPELVLTDVDRFQIVETAV